MSFGDAQLDRFVRALHGRQVALRIAEGAGVGLLGGCAAAVLLVPVLLWRGQDAWGVAAAALGLGALAGAGWGVARRPDALAAAAEADRQLGTADLLGTAWALRATNPAQPSPADPWRQSVLAQAATRCAALSPSGVLLRRFGGRAWGGIALAVALVATLASFSSGPLRADSRGPQLADSRSQAPTTAARPILQLGADGSTIQRRAEQNPGDERDRGKKTVPIEGPEDADPEPDSAASGDPSDSSPKSAAAGAGDGTGRTKPENADPAQPDPASNAPDATTSEPGGERGAGGTGRAARDPDGSGDSGGGMLAGAETTPATPPRQHGSWDAAVEAAGEAIRAGRVGEEHRDLVRGYFDRPAAAATAR